MLTSVGSFVVMNVKTAISRGRPASARLGKIITKVAADWPSGGQQLDGVVGEVAGSLQ